ncbi:hypothetical protein Q9966_012458 [Columba livia]|nr:hypothetical protein Q9966_012458 [Columba livia]
MKSDGDLASTDKISSDIFQSSVVVSCCHGTQESALQPCSSPQLYDQGVVGKQKSHTVYSWLKYTKLKKIQQDETHVIYTMPIKALTRFIDAGEEITPKKTYMYLKAPQNLLESMFKNKARTRIKGPDTDFFPCYGLLQTMIGQGFEPDYGYSVLPVVLGMLFPCWFPSGGWLHFKNQQSCCSMVQQLSANISKLMQVVPVVWALTQISFNKWIEDEPYDATLFQMMPANRKSFYIDVVLEKRGD